MWLSLSDVARLSNESYFTTKYLIINFDNILFTGKYSKGLLLYLINGFKILTDNLEVLG
jgi:hypothetical protein